MKKASAIIIVCLIIGCASQHSSTATNTLSQTHPEQSKEDASQIKQQKVFYSNIDDAFNAMTHHLDKLSDDAVKSAFDLAVAELKKDPAHVRANIVLFKAHLYKANEDQVVEQFKKLIILTPKVSEECIELGTIFAQLGKISHAIRQFQASVDINPSFIPGYYNLGRAYFMKRHYEESIKAYEKTIELAPKHYRAWNNLGWIYMVKKDFKKATDMISNALEIKPDYAVAYMNLGTINLLQKKMDDAEKEFKHYIELKPDDPEGYRNLASVYQQRQQMDKAIDTIRKLLTHKPDDLIAMNNLAVLLLSKARYGESVRLLKTVYNTDIADKKFKSEVSKTLAVASFHLAEALADHSDKKKQAIQAYEDYLEYAENLSEEVVKQVEDKISALQ